jgi:hypothetical protein
MTYFMIISALLLHHHYHHLSFRFLALVIRSGSINSREVFLGVVLGFVSHVVDVS